MKIVEFIYDKTIKRPKRLRKNVFVIFTRKNSTTTWRKCTIRHESIDLYTKLNYIWMYTTTNILREWNQTR